MEARRGLQALEDLVDLSLVRYPHDLLLSRIWDLRNNLTAYDAAYVALAEALAAPLVTRDAALASPGAHRARVELMSLRIRPPPRRRPAAMLRGGICARPDA